MCDLIGFNLEFWDCECTTNYIHHTTESKCSVCGAEQVDQPTSIGREVISHFCKKHGLDKVVIHGSSYEIYKKGEMLFKGGIIEAFDFLKAQGFV